MIRRHSESHLVSRVGWLRAAVMGANDGLISTASLRVGVASATSSSAEVLTAGIAGLAAGAMSMAAGEYVSVSSQSDTEQADLARERLELESQPELETAELAQIYESRGVSKDVALQVARELMKHDALGAHARDELGITEISTANPIQAAVTSAITFSVGAVLPVIVTLISPPGLTLYAIFATTLVFLAALGALSAQAGGANILKPTLRVTFWGAFAMGATAIIGALIGKAL